MTDETRHDPRGFDYRMDVHDTGTLPAGWALCLTCWRAWDDTASTSVTPAPSARCPFEYDHGTTCTACGTAFPIYPAGHTGATGYAIRADGSRICYACADAAMVAEINTHAAPVFAYWRWPEGLHGVDAHTARPEITSWTGGTLPVRVTEWREHRDRYGYRYATGRAVSNIGHAWSFRAAVDNGDYIKLRPVRHLV